MAPQIQMALKDSTLHHAVHVTLEQIGSWGPSPDFWLREVPLLAQNFDAVRHALHAIGIAHKSFLCRNDASIDLGASKSEHQIMQQYNAAIVHLRQTTQHVPHQTRIQLNLVTCVLFICLENIRGHYAESTRHFKAGSALLLSTLQSEGLRRDDGMKGLVLIFSRFGTNITDLFHDQPSTSLGLLEPLAPLAFFNTSQSICPFVDLAAAERELDQIEAAYDVLNQLSGRDMAEHSARDGVVFWPWKIKDRITSTAEGRDGLYRIVRRFGWWSACFDLFSDSHVATTSPAIILGLARLRLQQKCWTALLRNGSAEQSTINKALETDLRAIVDQAVIVAQTSNLQQGTIKFDGEVVPALAFSACSTDDTRLLQRIVVVLKALNTREGIWDSHDMAEILEALLHAKQRAGEWHGVRFGDAPSLLGSLKSLETSQISPTNSFVTWLQEP